APDQGGHAPARAPLPLERRAGLPDARAAGPHLEAQGRAPGAFRADRLRCRLPGRAPPWYTRRSMRAVNAPNSVPNPAPLAAPGFPVPRVAPTRARLGSGFLIPRVQQ